MKHEPIENLRQYLNTGSTWRDIGQMDDKTRAWLIIDLWAQPFSSSTWCNL